MGPEELPGLLADSRFLAIPDAGHLLQHDAPASVMAALAGFLRP